jgi:hypothetical protein
MKYIITLENSIPAPMSRADRCNSSFVVPIRSGQAPSTDGDICFNSAEETGWRPVRTVDLFTPLQILLHFVGGPSLLFLS